MHGIFIRFGSAEGRLEVCAPGVLAKQGVSHCLSAADLQSVYNCIVLRSKRIGEPWHRMLHRIDIW